MQIPLEISFRNVIKTDELDNLIREKVNKLNRFCDYITSCHVAVEKPIRYNNIGSPYRVRINLRIPPGHEIVIKREPGQGKMNDSPYAIIRDAFEAAKRRIQALAEKQRSNVKSHPEQEKVAIVSGVFYDEKYGFIKTPDGRDIYFHKNSVLHNEFKNIKPGTEVRFSEEEGERGPQASTIQIVNNLK
jgi:cold shock CspA family protein/ribosome-associated translation inhibitor RaiA